MMNGNILPDEIFRKGTHRNLMSTAHEETMRTINFMLLKNVHTIS